MFCFAGFMSGLVESACLTDGSQLPVRGTPPYLPRSGLRKSPRGCGSAAPHAAVSERPDNAELPEKRERTVVGREEGTEDGLTWVWMILCRQSVLACLKPFPQTLQTKGLAPVCTGIWRVKL